MSTTALSQIPGNARELARSASGSSDAAFLRSPFAKLVAQWKSAQGEAAAAALVRQILGELLDEQEPRIEELNLPPDVRTMIAGEFMRIRKNIAERADATFDIGLHPVRSDYRIAGFGRVPVGIEHMELSGIPRSLFYRGGARQAARFLKLVANTRGFRPLYQIHMRHGVPPVGFLMVYTPDAQTKLFRTIAECLKLNPHVRGLIASSWWYDPELERVSPHMTFLREGFVSRGALLFRYGESESKHGLANSHLRQKLYDEGKYVPVGYTIVWPRDWLIGWADSSSDR